MRNSETQLRGVDYLNTEILYYKTVSQFRQQGKDNKVKFLFVSFDGIIISGTPPPKWMSSTG